MRRTTDQKSGAQVDDQVSAASFQIAGWMVHPTTNRMRCGSDRVKLEPKVMQVLVYLVDRRGQTVTRDELARAVWSGTVVGDDAVTSTIIKLRKALGDDPRSPQVIETIAKQGYRLVASVKRPSVGENATALEMPPLSAAADSGEFRTTQPTIAVLPFRNLSGDAAQEYFSDGITEDITTALSNTGWHYVTARHSSFSYKGKAIDVRQAGKELGVQYILEGSVQKVGDKLRVTADLIETASGKHIWGNRYDGRLADVFDFQDQITETIVGTVEGMFQHAEGERISHKRPETMEAYDHLLHGLAYMNKVTPEDTQTALQYFYRAIEMDPRYARAYAYAFWCYRRKVQLCGMVLSGEERAEAIRLMNAGLKADRDDPVVLWQAATLKLLFEHDLEGARALLERSLSIDPTSPRAWISSGMLYNAMGDSETARKHVAHALPISPRNPSNWVAYTVLAIANLQEGRYEEATEFAKKVLWLNNYMIQAHLILAASCAHLERLDEARAAVKQSLKLNPRLTIARLTEFFPIARYKNLDAYLEGLRKAGLPE